MASQKDSPIAVAPHWFGARRLQRQILTISGAFLLFGGHATNALAYEDVAFEELGGDECFMFSQLVPMRTEGNNVVELPLELVINNDEDYRKLFDPKDKRKSCADVDLSKLIVNVDFSKKTVLGLWSSGTCMATGFEKKVMRDDKQKTIIYSVSVISSPRACMKGGPESLNLIAIPKVPAAYKVSFENIPE
jgi:hypothetical protein